MWTKTLRAETINQVPRHLEASSPPGDCQTGNNNAIDSMALQVYELHRSKHKAWMPPWQDGEGRSCCLVAECQSTCCNMDRPQWMDGNLVASALLAINSMPSLAKETGKMACQKRFNHISGSFITPEVRHTISHRSRAFCPTD